MSKAPQLKETDALDAFLYAEEGTSTKPEKKAKTKTEKTVWVFCKNQNPKEVITLEDGTKVKADGPRWIVTDSTLAEAIRKVGHKYNAFEI